jgi:hypothetical protein
MERMTGTDHLAGTDIVRIARAQTMRLVRS